MAKVMILAHEALCIALFYSVFCRAVRSCERVRLDIRVAFFILGGVSCAGMAAPLVWGFVPDVFTLVLLGCFALVQLVTAKHWANGVPHGFYRAGCRPQRRPYDHS